MEPTLTAEADTELFDYYLAHRRQLVRFFTVRTQSRDTAEDIVQDIALRLQALPPSSASSVDTPLPFIYRIGINLMLDRVKQSRRTQLRDLSWTQTQTIDLNGACLHDGPDAEATVAARQQLARVVEIMEKLGPQCRRAFHLHKFEGLTHAEVAARMQISRSAVEKHISTALKVLLREMRHAA